MAGAILVAARRPQVITEAEFRVEDGQTFFLGTFFGSPIEGVVRPYQGYLHVVPRLGALLERAAPISFAPLVANVAAIAIAVSVAGYIASGRLASVVPDSRVRLALGALVLFLPGVAELHGSITFAQWYLAIFLIGAAFALEPISRRGRAVEILALGLAGLTGPAILLIAPLHIASAAVNRGRWRAATAVCTSAAAIVQLGFLAVSSREAPGGGSLQDATDVVALRALVEPILGARLVDRATVDPVLTVALTAGIIACLVVVARGLSRRWLIVLGYVWLSSVAATLIGSIDKYSVLLDPINSQRYFYISGLAIGALVIMAVARHRKPVPVVLAALLVIGVVADFRIAPLPTHDWAVNSACIGGLKPCRVPVEPTFSWTIHWPGLAGPYNQNRVYEPPAGLRGVEDDRGEGVPARLRERQRDPQGQGADEPCRPDQRRPVGAEERVGCQRGR